MTWRSDPCVTAIPADLRPRVLVADHNRRNLSVMARRIADAGFRVTAADSGSAAVAELHRAPMDLVIAALDMPRMSGAELTRIIRGEVAWADLPVILVSGRSQAAGAVAGFAAGADDVILKPFHFEVLIARIARRIAHSRSLQSLRNDNAALDARLVARAIEVGEMREQLRRLSAA